MNDKWYVVEVYGDRAVLGKNQSGTHNIQSPIKVSNLNGGSSGGGSVSLSTFDHYEVQWYYDTIFGLMAVLLRPRKTKQLTMHLKMPHS